MLFMNLIKQIFIDLDGPLLDGKEKHYFCYQTILKNYDFEPIPIDEYWKKKRALFGRRDLLSLSGAEIIYDKFLITWLDMIESPEALALDKLQKEVINCLQIWSAKKIKLILVTMRKNKSSLEDQLTLIGLRPFLDAVLVCDHADGAEGKADVVRNNYPGYDFKDNSLWIGDTEIDWAAAQSLRCKCILLENGLRNGDYLRSLKSAVVKESIVSLKGLYVS
jgi:phosphoglycolate phosphatase-like HAD superfamily hydrolase